MLLGGSILAGVARFSRRGRGAGKLSWWLDRQPAHAVSDSNRPRAKRFLILDITNPNSGEIRSVGLHLMPHPASPRGARVYGATIVDQSSSAYSARFVTDGRHCLVVFVGDARGASLLFQIWPWSRGIVVTGTLPNEVASSDDNDATSTWVRQHCDAARSIIDAEHPTSQSDFNRIRRRVAKFLHPDLGPAMEVACRAQAMALMNAELDEMGSRFAA
jgi:hypothetical protein